MAHPIDFFADQVQLVPHEEIVVAVNAAAQRIFHWHDAALDGARFDLLKHLVERRAGDGLDFVIEIGYRGGF